MINIVELLSLRGLDLASNIKIVRHQVLGHTLDEMLRKRQMEIYQCYQSENIYENCDYIISFVGLKKSKARFMGVYKVIGCRPAYEVPLPGEFLFHDLIPINGYHYELEEDHRFDDMKWRVVIDWGISSYEWCEWLIEKEVVEILPEGYVKEFPGLLNFTLSYDELVSIIDYPDANKEWHQALSGTPGIFMISDTKTGKQYIGCAGSEKGILERWSEYARNPDGGNEELGRLLLRDKNYAKNLQYTILYTLPCTPREEEEIKINELINNKAAPRESCIYLN